MSDTKRTWKLTTRQRQEAIDAYLSGATTHELAAKHGVLESSMRSLISRHVQLRPQVYPASKITPEIVAKVVEVAATGAGIDDVRAAAEVDLETFYRWRKNGRLRRGDLYQRLEDGLLEAFKGIAPASRAQRQYTLNEYYFDVIDTEEKAYWLGFIAADGNVRNSSLSINLAIKDRTHLDKFLLAVGSDAPLHFRDSLTSIHPNGSLIRGGPQAHLRLASKHMVEGLVAAGIHPNKTFTVRPWDGPPHLLRHYYRGVIDGDGCVTCSARAPGKQPDWSIGLVGNERMVNGFRDFVFKQLGRLQRCHQRGNTYAVSFGGTRFAQKLATLLYGEASVSLDRKKLLAEQCMQSPVRRDWSELTHQDLMDLHRTHKTWPAVAKVLGTTRDILTGVRRRAVNRSTEPRT